MILQKTISLFRKAYLQATCLTGHKTLEIWAFILAIMASHLLLLELGHGSCNFSRHGWFMRLSLSWPSSGEQSITINVSTNQSCCYNNFEIQLTICRYQVLCKQHDCLHVWHPWDQKTCSSKSGTYFCDWVPASSCFLTHYIYTIYTIVAKLDDVRTKTSNVLWILSDSHQYIAQSRLKILLEKIH